MGNILDRPAQLTEPVETQCGRIVGRKIIAPGSRPVNAFQGIPFGKPPLKALRFKKPEPPEPWKDVRRTVGFRARPIQKDEWIGKTLSLPCRSEDCLQLNVFAPAWPAVESEEGKWPVAGHENVFPVMVFVHGGGFIFDSAVKYGDVGIASHLVGQCETIVVTIEYRLGYLGFFATGDDACDDNVGLWDMVAALEWVRDNIANFRGDPNNVTLFGQSAGGCAVDLLSISPAAKGLFHRVIPMSGNADCTWAFTKSGVEKCRQLAGSFGLPTVYTREMMAQLRSIDASRFALGMADIGKSLSECVIAPRLAGDLLPGGSLDRLRDETTPFARLIGVCQYEGIMYGKDNLTLGMVEARIASQIPEADFPDFVELRKKALDLYIQPADYATKAAIDLAWVNCISDVFVSIAVQKNVLEQLRRNNSETYLYSFDYCNPESLYTSSPIKGATHCLDLNYLLYNFMFRKYKFNETDNRVLRILTKLWSNFAKYGNPNGSPAVPTSRPEGAFEWLPATKDHPSRYLSIGPDPKMAENFQNGRPMFCLELEKKRQNI